MSSSRLRLSDDAAVEQLRAATQAACEQWQREWAAVGPALTVSASVWIGRQCPAFDVPGEWRQATGSAAAIWFWPKAIEHWALTRLYPDTEGDASTSGDSLAAHSARSATLALRSMLMAAWHIDGEGIDVQPGWRLSRWNAPVRVDIALAGDIAVSAVVPMDRLPRAVETTAASPPQRADLDGAFFDGVSSPLTLHVGQASLPLADAASLQIGDVIVLDAPLSKPAEMTLADGTVVLQARLGRLNGQRAALVTNSSTGPST